MDQIRLNQLRIRSGSKPRENPLRESWDGSLILSAWRFDDLAASAPFFQYQSFANKIYWHLSAHPRFQVCKRGGNLHI
jgi:hypothetical protein